MARQIRDRNLESREAVETPYGFKFAGIEAMQKGTFEPEETALFQKLVEDVDVVLNIGANVGFYCCFALKAGKEVIAFEPNSDNLACLFKNLETNGWNEECEVFPLALSNRKGSAKFYGSGLLGSLVPGWAGNAESVSTTVPLNTLDNVLGDRLAGRRVLVVLDVEGAELDVLAGASKFLMQEPRPLWMTEANIEAHFPGQTGINSDFAPLFHKFWQHGYSSWTATEQPAPVSEATVENVEKGLAHGLETHNFLFTAKGIEL